MKFYQLFIIKWLGEYDVPQNISELLDQYETLTDEMDLTREDPQVQILYYGVRIELWIFKNNFEKALVEQERF